MSAHTNHTPGPWKVKHQAEPSTLEIKQSGGAGYLVAHVYGGGNEMESHLHDNARLIAAAPQLLEALEEAMEWSRYDHAKCTTTGCWCQRARSAISLAVEKQP
jgi:hypothetical protein